MRLMNQAPDGRSFGFHYRTPGCSMALSLLHGDQSGRSAGSSEILGCREICHYLAAEKTQVGETIAGEATGIHSDPGHCPRGSAGGDAPPARNRDETDAVPQAHRSRSQCGRSHKSQSSLRTKRLERSSHFLGILRDSRSRNGRSGFSSLRDASNESKRLSFQWNRFR